MLLSGAVTSLHPSVTWLKAVSWLLWIPNKVSGFYKERNFLVTFQTPTTPELWAHGDSRNCWGWRVMAATLPFLHLRNIYIYSKFAYRTEVLILILKAYCHSTPDHMIFSSLLLLLFFKNLNCFFFSPILAFLVLYLPFTCFYSLESSIGSFMFFFPLKF